MKYWVKSDGIDFMVSDLPNLLFTNKERALKTSDSQGYGSTATVG